MVNYAQMFSHNKSWKIILPAEIYISRRYIISILVGGHDISERGLSFLPKQQGTSLVIFPAIQKLPVVFVCYLKMYNLYQILIYYLLKNVHFNQIGQINLEKMAKNTYLSPLYHLQF